jgi:hypothetical protein
MAITYADFLTQVRSYTEVDANVLTGVTLTTVVSPELKPAQVPVGAITPVSIDNPESIFPLVSIKSIVKTSPDGYA